MWLINTESCTLELFNDPVPPYAILSHTWSATEVTFQDFVNGAPKDALTSSGWSKIVNTCTLAHERGLNYAWVDTCCIDKTSSAELSEAINSMFSWYKHAAVCFAHLEDSDGKLPDGDRTFMKESEFGRCKWFRRGWTLQELIAPKTLIFYDAGWRYIATKHDISGTLEVITGISAEILTKDADLFSVSVRTRMRWAAGRDTTRTEDVAYCLLGIFNVNLPLIYGEGYKAFQRLQEEIAYNSSDLSIFAWSSEGMPQPRLRPPQYRNATKLPLYRGAFAWAPEEFAASLKGSKKTAVEVRESIASPGKVELDRRAGVMLRNMSIRWEGLLAPPRFLLEIPLERGLVCRAIEKTTYGYAFKNVSLPLRLNVWKYSASEVRLVGQNDAMILEAEKVSKVYLRVDMKVALVAPTLTWPIERWDRVPQWFMYSTTELASMVSPTVLGVGLVRPQINVQAATGGWEPRRLDMLTVISVIPSSDQDEVPRLLGTILVKQSENQFAKVVHSFIEGQTSNDTLHDAVLYMQRNLRSAPEQWIGWAEKFDKEGQVVQVDTQGSIRIRGFSAEKPVEYIEGSSWWNFEIWHDWKRQDGKWITGSWASPINLCTSYD